ncbi:MAG: OmpA family protein [Sediminibacterium sp.]|nr:OmpA family protein [Sediminibacterium sp.]
MSFWSRLTGVGKISIALLVAAPIVYGVYKLAPGIKVEDAKTVKKIDVNGGDVNNQMAADELPLPADEVSSEVSSKPLVRISGYAWNAQSGIIVANGGAKTAKGSLMEKNGVNLEILREDWLSELRNKQMKFVEEFDKGNANPTEGVMGLMIMGDGAPYYISSAQQALNDKYGNKYHLQIVGSLGLSYGEDKLIGPVNWKKDPKSMKGSLISAVIGDGDWVVAVNYASANGLKINPDPSTFDEEAVNFLAAENDDYIEASKVLIKSQLENYTVELKEVKNGKLTGKKVNKKVDGCATWTPGDKMVFDALNGFTDIVSTKEFNNQMSTVLIVVKEWADKNQDVITNILKSSFTASNQMKQHDNWRKRASECVAKSFNQETPDYWYKMFAGQKAIKNGIEYNMGGSRVFNYADAMQYYGITDGVNRYKAVYDQVSSYLTDLNPMGFNQSVKRVVPYEEAVNLYYIKNINDIESGTATKSDYSKTATQQIASGEWKINFKTGSTEINSSSNAVLNEIYNLLIQAEDSKLELEGHTDNVGNEQSNLVLSEGRASAVKQFLIRKGVNSSRFQSVSGKGQSEPVADNGTEQGRAQNRRVVIKLLK